RQVIGRIRLDQLPEEIALRRGQLGCRKANLAAVRALAPRIGENVVDWRVRQPRPPLQSRAKITDQPPRQRLPGLQRNEAGMATGGDSIGIARERGRRDRNDLAIPHSDRLVQMVAFEPEAPDLSVARSSIDGE